MESGTHTIVRYSRSGGRTPPRDRERLEISPDGTFAMWRSIGSASHPPSPIGRFAGALDPALVAQLRREVAAAAQAGDLNVTPPPDAAIETIEVGDVRARLGIHEEPAGPWGALTQRLRQLLRDLADYPQAAIALEVILGGQGARLVHRGEEPFHIDLRFLTTRAVLWHGFSVEGDWRPSEGLGSAGGDLMADLAWSPDLPVDYGLDVAEGEELVAGPGWSLDLPFDHGFDITQECEVVAYVTFEVHDGEEPITVSLQSPRAGDI